MTQTKVVCNQVKQDSPKYICTIHREQILLCEQIITISETITSLGSLSFYSLKASLLWGLRPLPFTEKHFAPFLLKGADLKG